MTSEPRVGAVLYAKDKQRVAAFYAAVLGLRPDGGDAEHVRLESEAFQLVVLRMPSHIASTIDLTLPPTRRNAASIKLVFFVDSLADIRAAAAAHGGGVNATAKEWAFDGWTVCDGVDPEGNVIQFRVPKDAEQVTGVRAPS